jgi:hypothetical protein
MRPEIILIGAIRVGKSTLGTLIAGKLGVPQVSLDEVGGRYFEEIGFDAEVARQLEKKDLLALLQYLWPFYPHVVERVLGDHHDCVIDLGAGHTVYEDASAFARVEQALAPYPNVLLILPSPDPDRSSTILRERTADLEWLREIQERHGLDLNDHFLRHPSNYRLAKLIVYTEGKSPEETRDEILERVKL